MYATAAAKPAQPRRSTCGSTAARRAPRCVERRRGLRLRRRLAPVRRRVGHRMLGEAEEPPGQPHVRRQRRAHRRPRRRPAAAAGWCGRAGAAARRSRRPPGTRAAPPYLPSPRIGVPSSAQCARNWWVRPVSGSSASQAALRADPLDHPVVGDRRPAGLVGSHPFAGGAAPLGERLLDPPHRRIAARPPPPPSRAS